MLVAITSGEPAGIGPDIILTLAQQALPACPVVIGDRTLFSARAKQLSLNIDFIDADCHELSEHTINTLAIKHIELGRPAQTSVLDANNAQYVLNTIQQGVDGCLNGQYEALVTAPIQKSIINDAGIAFSGHTELLGELTQTEPVMMLVNDSFRVALVTTHLPLERVAKHITKAKLEQIISILHKDLKKTFALPDPRILVAGLNPHAGENGHLGLQEQNIIEPTIKQFQAQGFSITGPLPADTLFTQKYLSQCDAVLTMYHDQGLPVLKYAGFGSAVNITLGLPIIRTSVDHGTALPLAGTGKANASSLSAAFNMACELAHNKRLAS